jgi:histidinol dehydrogenase
MQIIKYPKKEIGRNFGAPDARHEIFGAHVANILTTSKRTATRRCGICARHFDKVELDDFLVSEAEFAEAEARVSAELKDAIKSPKRTSKNFTGRKPKSRKLSKRRRAFSAGANPCRSKKSGFTFRPEPRRFFRPF